MRAALVALLAVGLLAVAAPTASAVMVLRCVEDAGAVVCAGVWNDGTRVDHCARVSFSNTDLFLDGMACHPMRM